MYRIDNRYAAAQIPPPAAQGPEGFFTAGDPATGVSATIVDADWLNAVQEELIYCVTRGGLTPNKASRTQLLEALANLFTGAWQVLRVTQNLVVPYWATRFAFELVAGGGSGGHSYAQPGGNYWAGAGGGAGGAALGQRNVTPGGTIQVIIGNGGSAAGGAQNAGGTSSISFAGQWSVTCSGGAPGTYHSDGYGAAGGQGGMGWGDVNDILVFANYGYDGQSGSYAALAAQGVAIIGSGHGGPGLWGGGGRAGHGGGAPGGGPSSGGSGAYNTAATGNFYNGGNGANGLCRYRFMP